MIERIYYRVKLNTDQIIYAQYIDIAQLEAKLNENIVKDLSKTYLVWKGSQFPNSSNATFKAPEGCTIDWGDGNVETFETTSTVVNTHTYTDGIEYHLIVINGLTSISDWAFYGCSGLTSVTIGNGVTSIRYSALSGCSGLKTIRISAINPPTLGSNAFETSIEKIIVPKSAINTYKSATGWSTYADKIVYEVDSSDISDTSNFVTLSGAQTISGHKTFNNHISLHNGPDGYIELGGN